MYLEFCINTFKLQFIVPKWLTKIGLSIITFDDFRHLCQYSDVKIKNDRIQSNIYQVNNALSVKSRDDSHFVLKYVNLDAFAENRHGIGFIL